MNTLADRIIHSGYDIYFLVVDSFLDISLPEFNNFSSLTASKLDSSIKNSGKLLSHPASVEFIQNNTKLGRKVAIVPFKPSSKVDFICRQNGWKLIANPAALNRQIEDKVGFYKNMAALDFPVIPAKLSGFDGQSFTDALNTFGTPLVVQSRYGWAGNSSFIASSYAELSSQIPHDTPVKYSPYLRGYSLINNCCLTTFGLLQSPPALQYTGIAPLTQNPLATVGRQWPSAAPDNVIESIKSITDRFAKDYLVPLNYRGFFGLDFLVSDNKVFVVECNPRLTASFAFYTDIEKQAGEIPLFFFHLAEFIGLLKESDIKDNRFYNPKIVGSEITSKNDSGATVKKYHDFTKFVSDPNNISLPKSLVSKVL